jgi:GMP synthase (glutamine-hydrolysing)
MRPPICLYVVGAPPAPIASIYGDFADYFGRLFGSVAAWEVFDGHGPTLPHLADYAAVVITGSPASLATPEPWMDAGIELVRRARRQATPLLGVCFGHQLIGAACGAEVVENPAGWELGSYEIEVGDGGRADPLFADLPARFPVNLSHRDIVAATADANPALEVLATTRRTQLQVIAAGPNTRGVQFHPEFTAAITRAYLEERRDALASDATRRNAPADQPDRLSERIVDCPVAEQLFANFLRHWVIGN